MADDAGGTTTEGANVDTGADYSGLLGAIRYAYRRTDSRLMRSYVVVGTVLVVFVTLLFVQSLVVVIGSTVGAGGGTFTFVRAFVIVVGLYVIGPLLAPVVSTARRHRHGTAVRQTDAVMALLGYSIIVWVYVALLISAPPGLRNPATGVLAPVVETLYAWPPVFVAIPLLFVTLVTSALWVLHRRAGSADRQDRNRG